MLLTKKPQSGAAALRTQDDAARSPFVHSLQRGLSRALPTMDRRAFLRRSGLGVGVGIAASQPHAGEEGPRRRGPRDGRRQGQDRGQAHRLHALLGGLRDRRGRRERRVGAPGAGVRLADQPGRALRQGRGRPRARPRRVPPALPDEAGERQVRAHQLGRRAERDQRQAAGAAQGQRPRLGVLGRLVQAQQRAGVPDAQVRQLLRQQQHRPPGAHLPLHHRRGRREHVGLRRDDQFVQRHAEQQAGVVHRLERGRGAPGVDAAHAARQGDRAAR